VRDAAAIDVSAALERVPRQLGFTLIGANVAGAVIVYVFTAFVLKTPGVPHQGRVTLINAIVFVSTLPLGVRFGVLRIRRQLRMGVAWIGTQSEPTLSQREALIRFPLTQLRVIAAIWIFPVVLFTALNAPFSGRVATTVAIAIALGGLVSCAISYLLAERVMRPLTVAALQLGVPERPQLPGVAARALLAWTLGSGVLLLAITLVAASAIGQRGLSTTRLGVSVIVLGVIGLAVGLLLITGLARSLAERIEALRIAAGAVGRGELEAEVTVDDGSELGLLQADFNRMVSGLRERERLRDLFGRQVGEDVVQHALERGVELGGEAREAAVLFIDLQGSTALAERRDPVEVVTLLNSFFAIVVEVVAAHSGWVNKFEGDAALCVFGAPLPDERAATNALAAARELAARLTSELGELSAGIGVSAGRVVAGNVGAAKRFEYTVIGDPVNEAARLCDLAKTRAERVLASGAALQRAETEERERWRPGEEITLRGRSAATVVAVPRPV
jgi:adenylate cyclase